MLTFEMLKQVQHDSVRRTYETASLFPRKELTEVKFMVEKTTQFSLAKIRSILFNLPNLFFLLILATFRFPSKYALEMDEKLKSPSVFIAVLVLIEIAFLFNVRKAKNEKTAKGIFSVVFIFLFLWELLVSRLNLFPYVFVPAPENVFYVFIRDTRNILKGFASSMQLLALGIIGEYLGQIFHESKGRPIYLVDEMNGKRMIYKPQLVPTERNIRD